METKKFITPSPRILKAIIHNPLKPIDALCELIDNSIDGFRHAKKSGLDIIDPTIRISIPNKNEIDKGIGVISVEDNGPGLTMEQSLKAVTAGYSGNPNPLDNLGLFGMGFNIATGKIGQRTVMTTCRKGDNESTSITIDLPKMIENESFEVPVSTIPKDDVNKSGTIVTIDQWYPREDALTYGFVQKLVGMSKADIRDRLGRIYSTLLGNDLKILVNNEECEKFHHCVWPAIRSVHHHEFGEIPAQYEINEVVGTEIRCNNCWHLIENGEKICSSCGEKDTFRTIEKKVYGWVGIQRFDNKDNFGIDLIRNGRVIRMWEKDAFFTYEDEDGNRIKEYPVDSIYGRIIGEIHIDFVPVDYLKSDFQRTSQEWDLALKCIRGEGSLLPRTRTAKDEGINNSPIYKLVQGYRKVRDFGTKELYMGKWDPTSGRAIRIDRKTEEEYYQKFRKGENGFGIADDSQWWKLVEEADPQSATTSKECPKCLCQNALTAETCFNCSHIFIGKKCINPECGNEIPKSAVNCEKCGSEQVTEKNEWKCPKCSSVNSPERTECLKCKQDKNSPNPNDTEYLLENSVPMDNLSVENFSIPLPGSEQMSSIKLSVYKINEDANVLSELPLIVDLSSSSEIKIFLNTTHPAINSYQDRPEDYIALEMARWIQDSNASKINPQNRHFWSLSNIYFLIHTHIWKSHIILDSQETKRDIDTFFSSVMEALPRILTDESEEIFNEFDDRDKALVIQELIRNGVQTSLIDEFKKTGKYFAFLPSKFIPKIIEKYPENFFDGGFWNVPFSTIALPDETIQKEVKEEILQKYLSCINDLISFRNYRTPDTLYTQKINQTLHIMNEDLINA